MKRLLLRLALAVLFLGLLAFGTALILIDPLVRATIEKGGTLATGVATEVESVDVGLLSPRFELAGLRVANPPGFEGPFVKLAQVRTSWDQGSLWSDRIEVAELSVEGLELDLVYSPQGSNWKPILEALERLDSSAPAPAPEGASSSGKALRIHTLTVRGARARLTLRDVPAGAGTRTLDLPPIVIEELATDGSAAELCAVVLRGVLGATIEAALKGGAGTFPPEALAALRGDFKGLQKQLERELEGLLKDPGSAAKDLLEGVKGLLDRR